MVRGSELKWLFALVPLFLVLSCAEGGDVMPDCFPDKGSCIKQMGEGRVIFEITPRPVRTMEDLIFTVKLEGMGSEPERILLDLSMPGMEMGENRIILERKNGGVYEGKGIIVRCPSGRRLWRATLWVPGAGETEFLFEVDREK